MTQRYDLVIAGGGPSGSAAAWQAAQTGAKVVVLDKAEFPRDKPCGDGLTARAVSYLQKMGLADEVATFHRVNRVTVFSPSTVGAVVPEAPRYARSRSHRQPRRTSTRFCSSTPSRRAPKCGRARKSRAPSSTRAAALSA